MARTLAAHVAALVALLTLTHAPARSEPQAGASGPPAAVGQPLNLTPSQRPTRQLHHTHTVEHPVAAKTSHRGAVQTAGAVNDGRAVLRGRDSSGLLAMLPWWRADPMETIRYLDHETGSGVLAAAEAWLGRPIAAGHAAATGQAMQHASIDDISEVDLATDVGVANADELNAIDLLAVAVTDPRKSDNAWLHALLAMLGGAMAAASTARYLFG
jgi:hypothetical protein